MHDDLTYAMLHDMKMKKFKLEANYALNLSTKLSSFDDTSDITDDPEIRTFVHCLQPLLIIDATHLNGQYKGTNLVVVGMDECIGDSPNLLFISDKHAAIALGVQNEFLLAFHVVCCHHLMMNLSLRRKKTKGQFWKICKAYTTEEFSTEMSNLQDVQPDAYHKLYEAGPQRWSRAH
ncbi:hypothetical protein Tco_0126587 [Tanacetum coccineum]